MNMTMNITRKDAIKTLHELWRETNDSWYKEVFDMAIEALSEMSGDISSLSSAKPKTGEWIKATGMMPPEFHGHHYCSECGNFANMEPPFGNREDLSKFCPNCGVKMKCGDTE